MNDRIKKHIDILWKKIKLKPYKWAAWIAIIFLIIPLIIFACYWIGDNYFVLIKTSLSVGDALGFYGSLLAFLGTVTLGAITIIQNNRATKQNNVLYEDGLRAQLPVFETSNADEKNYSFDNEFWNIGENYNSDICFQMQKDTQCGIEIGHFLFKLKNISEFPITNLKIIDIYLSTLGKTDFNHFSPVLADAYSLERNSEKVICVKLISKEQDFCGIDKNRVQGSMTFVCYNAQRRRVEFSVSFLLYDGCFEILQPTMPKYKEDTTNDKT